MNTLATHQERAEAVARDFLRGINEIAFDNKTFAEVVARDHRALQQSAVRAALAIIYCMAKKQDNEIDLRNKSAVEISKRIVDLLGDHGEDLPHI
jgi:hypothetical protein